MYLKLLFRHYIDDDCSQKAASLTYTTLLSIVPIITVLLVIFSSVPALAGLRGQLQYALYSNLLPSSGSQLAEYLQGFAEKSSNLTAIGIGFLFVTSIMTLITIETTFNQIWRVQERSGGLTSIMRYWTMITLGPIVLAIAFAATSMISSLDFLNRKVAGYGIDWGAWAYVLSIIITVLGFAAMYWFIPKVKVPVKNALIAGVVIGIIFELLKRVFGLVVTNFTSYEAVYGAFAAIPAFLMWLYLSWNLILLGVEISYTLTIFDTKEVAVRHPMLSLLDMLNVIFKNYKKGLSTSEQELRDILGRKELPKWQTYIAQLDAHGLITRTEYGEYTLKTDLQSISLWEFYKTLPYPLPIKNELDKLKAADYDPWFVELYDNLVAIEKKGSQELDTSLFALFSSTPIRQKQEIVRISAEEDADSKDVVDGQAASFGEGADTAVDDSGNTIIIPDGEAHFTESTLTKALRLGKKAIHAFFRGKKLIKDTKEGLK